MWSAYHEPGISKSQGTLQSRHCHLFCKEGLRSPQALLGSSLRLPCVRTMLHRFPYHSFSITQPPRSPGLTGALHFTRLLVLYERTQSVKPVCKEVMEPVFTGTRASSGSTHSNDYCIYCSSHAPGRVVGKDSTGPGTRYTLAGATALPRAFQPRGTDDRRTFRLCAPVPVWRLR